MAAALDGIESPGVRTPELEDVRSLIATALDDKNNHMATLLKVGTSNFPAAVTPTEINVRSLRSCGPASSASDVARLSQLRGILGLSERTLRQFEVKKSLACLHELKYLTAVYLPHGRGGGQWLKGNEMMAWSTVRDLWCESPPSPHPSTVTSKHARSGACRDRACVPGAQN